MSEYLVATYGGDVPTTKEVSDKWYNVMKCFSPGDGISTADLAHAMKLYEACLSGADAMKLTYFNKYGRGEAIRMALWKAGVEFEDIRLTPEEWKAKKMTPEFEFNCLPMLCHGDFKTSQSFSVLAYVGECYNLLPTDPYLRYLGESFAQYTWDDFFMGKIAKCM